MTIKEIIEEGVKQIEFINHSDVMGETAIVIDNNKGLDTIQEVHRHYQTKLINHIIEIIDEQTEANIEDCGTDDSFISKKALKQKLLQELGESK